MILKSLVSLYEVLRKQGKVCSYGYSRIKITLAIRISWEGELLGLEPLREGSICMQVPEQTVRTNSIVPFFLCDNGMYILGVDYKGNKEWAIQCFNAAKALHQEILSCINTPEAKAIIAFFSKWNPEIASSNEVIQHFFGIIATGAKFTFLLPDYSFAHQNPAILEAWDNYINSHKSKCSMLCLVTGKRDQPVTIIHNKIYGVNGALSSGSTLISFNNDSCESYGKERRFDNGHGRNAPISEYAEFAYVSALNYLLANKESRVDLGNCTLVYWAETGEPNYQVDFGSFLMSTKLYHLNDDHNGSLWKQSYDISAINPNISFYVLAISANISRLSVRFFWTGHFGSIIKNFTEHYDNLYIIRSNLEKDNTISIFDLLKETVSLSSSNHTATPLITGAILRSILTGSAYPEALAQKVISRILSERRISWEKVCILKAWLIKKVDMNNQMREVLYEKLNDKSKYKPYVLGRLFALLSISLDFFIYHKNERTMKMYLVSVITNPRNTFLLIIRLYNQYIRETKFGNIYNKQIDQMIDVTGIYEELRLYHFSFEEQGIFFLGFYHQLQSWYQLSGTLCS